MNVTITMSVAKYDELIRDSEKLATIKRLLNENKYMSLGDLRAIIGIAQSPVDFSGEATSFEEPLDEE